MVDASRAPRRRARRDAEVTPAAPVDVSDVATPLAAAAAAGLGEHAQLLGPLPSASGLVHVLREAGLTGRGGGAFPTWRKLAAAAAEGRRDGVAIANGSEGEPLSGKDAALVQGAPHLVLDGLQLVAAAAGAAELVVHVPPGPAMSTVVRAVTERRSRGWDPRRVRVLPAADSYLAGETSAVVAAVEGKRPVPRFTTVPAARSGVKGRPTVVQNVETLAHVAMIARFGSAWFRSRGTAEQPGTFLATVTGAVASPGSVVETEFGAPLGEVVGGAGGVGEDPTAVLLGGYHGTWLAMPEAWEASLSREGLARWDATTGAGVVHVLGHGECGLAATAAITAYLAGQSAGQCGPCRLGLPALAGATEHLARSGVGDEAASLAALVTGRGACHHPDGTARLVRSALRAFADDAAAHRDGVCLASMPALPVRARQGRRAR